jgi:3-hydroxyisobutyrate dehydrogenase-like beta-hydroxyacid dehydrogenase
MNEAIGFLGLGSLGLPMATHLVEAGYPVRVYNRTASKADPLVARGARLAQRPIEAVTPGGVVVSVLWDGAALEGVVTSDGFLERLGPGGVHVAMGTVLPATAKRLAALHARHGCAYVDAPVFGRPEAAVARKLWIPVAGAPDAKARVRPVLDAMGAQGVFDFGDEVGAATVVKLAGNFLIISAARSMGEALTLAGKTGVDTRAVIDMLTQTLFPAPIYQSYGRMIAEGAAPMTLSAIPQKDLGLFAETGAQVAAPTPIASHLAALLGRREGGA